MKRAITLLILSAIALSVSAGPLQAARSEVWARVLELDGKVFIEGRRAFKGYTARLGDEIRTGEDSTAVIKLKDKSVLYLRSKSSFVVKEGEEPGVIDLIAGKLLGVFSKGSHQIDTTTLSAGVRGTALYLMAEGPERTYACVCYGTVDFESTLDKSVRTTITADHPQGHLDGRPRRQALS